MRQSSGTRTVSTPLPAHRVLGGCKVALLGAKEFSLPRKIEGRQESFKISKGVLEKADIIILLVMRPQA